MSKKPDVVGGGIKKVLYTLNTVRKMGAVKAAKALSASNTCKACGLGMGGQMGGMTNELGEYPAVCNKSVQAQSSDVLPAIPHQIFDHTLDELRELNGRELDRLGRLTTPLYKAAGDDRYQPIDWDHAYAKTITAFKKTAPQNSFFYASGRSSNEAGFLFQLFARLYGTNNVTNCSYYCHQATGVGLDATVGSGTATIEVADLEGCDLVFVIGANPASNHPRLLHKLKGCRDRGGKIVVINPAKEPGLVKFALPKSPRSMLKGGDEIASHYLQPNIGSDCAVLMGIAKAVLEAGTEDQSFIDDFTLGYSDYCDKITALSWGDITEITGLTEASIKEIAQVYSQSERAVFAWGMGVTHHLNGVENVEAIASLALLRGMIGKRYAGLLPLRGHSNVQGIGTIGVKPVLAENVFAAMENEFDITLPRTEGLDTLASLRAARAGDMQAALIMGGNLFAATPDRKFAGEALSRVGFKAFMTTSLNEGHLRGIDGDVVIFPVTARDEEWSPTTQESMFNFVRLSDGGIMRHSCIRPESVILADLADGILADREIPFTFDAFKDHRKAREAISKIVPNMAALKDIDVAKKEFHVAGRLLHTPDFKTASAKAQFKSAPLPVASVGKSDFPFALTTIRSEGQFNSIIYEERDSYRQTSNRWSVLMNAEDIVEMGIAVGASVTITSSTGTMKNVEVYSFDVPRGNVLAYYPEANILTTTDYDPRSKTPPFKNIAVKVTG